MCGETPARAEQCCEPKTGWYLNWLSTDVQWDDGRTTLVSTYRRRKNEVAKRRRLAVERPEWSRKHSTSTRNKMQHRDESHQGITKPEGNCRIVAEVASARTRLHASRNESKTYKECFMLNHIIIPLRWGLTTSEWLQDCILAQWEAAVRVRTAARDSLEALCGTTLFNRGQTRNGRLCVATQC